MFLKKLIDMNQIAIVREKHCYSYCGLRHWISDNCCPSKKKTYFNVAKLEKIRSELEWEMEKA